MTISFEYNRETNIMDNVRLFALTNPMIVNRRANRKASEVLHSRYLTYFSILFAGYDAKVMTDKNLQNEVNNFLNPKEKSVLGIFNDMDYRDIHIHYSCEPGSYFSININFDSFPDEQMDEETHKLMQETKDMKHNFLNNFNPHTSQADEEHELTPEEVKAQATKDLCELYKNQYEFEKERHRQEIISACRIFILNGYNDQLYATIKKAESIDFQEGDVEAFIGKKLIPELYKYCMMLSDKSKLNAMENEILSKSNELLKEFVNNSIIFNREYLGKMLLVYTGLLKMLDKTCIDNGYSGIKHMFEEKGFSADDLKGFFNGHIIGLAMLSRFIMGQEVCPLCGFDILPSISENTQKIYICSNHECDYAQDESAKITTVPKLNIESRILPN